MAALQGKKINRVASGSAHTLAWSTNKPVATSKLPAAVSVFSLHLKCGNVRKILFFSTQVPLEFDLLKEMSPAILRNRLVLLHHFSDTICPCITMFSLGFQVGFFWDYIFYLIRITSISYWE